MGCGTLFFRSIAAQQTSPRPPPCSEPPFSAVSNMLLVQRNPSVNWEPIPFDASGQLVAWVWFRPAAVPTGMMFVLPPTLFADANLAARLSVRQLVAATGLDPSQILGWTVGRLNFDAVGGTSPLLDQLLPPPPADANLDLSVWMVPVPQPGWPAPPPVGAAYPAAMGQMAYAPSGGSAEDAQLLGAIESCWNSVLQIEVRVATLRKDLGTAISRLNSLNRDLSSDERRTCDSKDLQEWADARRWLRDSISVMSRSVKEIDVGTTSGAGRRHRFEEMYRDHVVPRIPFPGLQQAVNEIETYRKILQSVVASAQASLAKAGRDAESRANSVLQRVGAKMRARRK